MHQLPIQDTSGGSPMNEPTRTRPESTRRQLETTLATACAARGLDATGARLLHHYSNAVYLLPAYPVVARVAIRTPSRQRVNLSQRVTRWLVDKHDFGATAPLLGVAPVNVCDAIVSFWRYYPQDAQAPAPTSVHLGTLLRSLHRLEAPDFHLPLWTPLASLGAVVSAIETNAMTDAERIWLLDTIDHTREQVSALDWSQGHGLIHGDAWAGNLLWRDDVGQPRPILGDWDSTSYGPREVDLIPTWHAGQRYGKGSAWVQGFVDEYGFDLSGWSGFPALFAMRDLVQLTGPLRRARGNDQYLRAFRQRFESIRAGDLSSTWVAL